MGGRLMPRHERVPEAADGGYWLVVPAVIDEDGMHPGVIPGDGWCAWYRDVDGVTYAAVRTPDPVLGVDAADVPVAAIVEEWGRKPRGRIRGH